MASWQTAARHDSAALCCAPPSTWVLPGMAASFTEDSLGMTVQSERRRYGYSQTPRRGYGPCG